MKLPIAKGMPQAPRFRMNLTVTRNIGWFNGMCPSGSSSQYSNRTLSRRAPQAKKHKTWEGDGILVVTKPKAALMDLEGRMYASDCPLCASKFILVF